MSLKNLSIISALCHIGQKKKGVMNGSYHIDKLIKKNNTKYNITNFFIDSECFCYKQLYNTHNNLLNLYDKNIITLGGDHSISHATISSSLQKYKDDVVVIWIDAHADINTLETSISKNTHGTPVSGLLGLEKNWIDNSIPKLNPKNLIYFGIRDMDPAEHNFIKMLNIKNYSNLSNILYYIFNNISHDKKIHISFDVDSIDPIYLDSTGTTSKYGLAPTEIATLIKYIIKYYNVIAIDITELNPSIGDIDKSLNSLEPIISVIMNTKNSI